MSLDETFKIICEYGVASITKIKEENGIYDYKFSFTSDGNEIVKPIHIRFNIPCVDIFSIWSPMSFLERNLKPDWRCIKNNSRTASGAPVESVISQNGINRLTVAISDAKLPITISGGVYEEESIVNFDIVFFTAPTEKRKSYEAIIRFDTRAIPFYTVIQDVNLWWETFYPPAFVPDEAKCPVYSTWYNYHEWLDVEDIVAQCRKAAEYGFKAIIVDDGWQTDGERCGYAYCGDWEAAEKKLGNMREFVDRVHETGLKFILWYSVPYIGEYSKHWDKFKHMVLNPGEKKPWKCLDVRYKEVRDYLADTYETAMRNWDLDGFKLDFIDSISFKEEEIVFSDSEGFIASLEEATELLLNEVKTRLTSVKPDVLIEFRQSYIGPAIRKYGNMLRVEDCPNDAIKNRVGVVDLRLTSGKTAVHSDMLMWNYNDTVESAAKQLLNVLFSVPQISIKFDKLNAEHLKMFEFYMWLWNKYKELLLDERICFDNSEMSYSKIWTQNTDAMFMISYDNHAEVTLAETVVVNGSGKNKMYIDIDKSYEVTIYNCMGDVINKQVFEQGVYAVLVPESGVIHFSVL